MSQTGQLHSDAGAHDMNNGGGKPTYVVGVGASAGGLEPLERFFESMPPTTGMAFVVVQHLSPSFRSVMDELLRRRTRMAVEQAENGAPVVANRVYLIPPRMEMTLREGRLWLSEQQREATPPLPIDLFFRSLAKDAKERAVAIILSGTGSDGSRGLKAVREAGGLTIAQDHETAKFDGMPRAAQDTGCVDATLAPEDMPDLLLTYQRDPQGLRQRLSSMQEEVTEELEQILRLLRQAHDIDFSQYKPSTVQRRIQRRIQIMHELSLSDYAKRLANDQAELNRLYKDLLIGVTRFFRDREAFQRLEQLGLPAVFEAVADGQHEIRAWVAACGTGEEAYSVAILLHEYAQMQKEPPQVRVFATDAHRASLDFASAGRYSREALAEVAPQRLARYFIAQDEGYQVAPLLRQTVTFAQQNLLRDAPFSRIDLVTCRNMLIYLRQPAQQQVLSMLHFALRPGGVLLLGPSETPGNTEGEFTILDQHWRLYRKRRGATMLRGTRQVLPPPRRQQATAIGPVRGTDLLAPVPESRLLRAYDALLARYAPPAVLVDDHHLLVHVFGSAREWLHPPAGRTNLDIVEMVSSTLRAPLAAALLRAQREGEPVRFRRVPVEVDGAEHEFELTVTPIAGASGETSYLLVTMLDQARENQAVVVQPNPLVGQDAPAPLSAEDFDALAAASQKIQSMEMELREARENLQVTAEEMQTSNEELNATNEELIASNEELQSTNEELHSVNEELYTVNSEYQRKITELTELSADMQHLLASTDIAVVFLDRSLCIRRFTPAVTRHFKLRASDLERPLGDITHSLEYPHLLPNCRQVLDGGAAVEEEIGTQNGARLLLRVLPYHSNTETIAGVVLTLVDLTQLKRAEARLNASIERFNAFMDHLPMPCWVRDSNGAYSFVNLAYQRLMGMDGSVCPGGERPEKLVPPAAMEALHGQEMEDGGDTERQGLIEVTLPAGQLSLMITRFRFTDAQGHQMYAGLALDVTEQRSAQKLLAALNSELATNNEELEERNQELDQFAHAASHDLRSPLRTILGFSGVLREQGLPDAQALDALNRIEGAARRMSILVESLLTYASYGRATVRQEKVDLNQCLRQVLADLNQDIEAAGATFDVTPLPTVRGDPAMVTQTLQNLVSNAIRYHRPDVPPHVRISSTPNHGQVVVQVSDNGTGIEARQLHLVFEPFQRLHSGERARGAGIGLAICRRAVERLGGRIWVESRVNEGSTFFVALPAMGAGDGANDNQ